MKMKTLIAVPRIKDKGMTVEYEVHELVRCSDCKYGDVLPRGIFCNRTFVKSSMEPLNAYKEPDWFCADGVERDE